MLLDKLDSIDSIEIKVDLVNNEIKNLTEINNYISSVITIIIMIYKIKCPAQTIQPTESKPAFAHNQRDC